MEIEFDDVDFVSGSAIAETAAGKHQHDQRRQQQDAAGGRKFLENRPEEFLNHVQTVAAPGESFRSLGGHVARIEAVAGAGIGFELRPELAQLHAFGDPLPEPAQPHSERKALRGCWFGRWRCGCHGSRSDYRGRSSGQCSVISGELRDFDETSLGWPREHWPLTTVLRTAPTVRRKPARATCSAYIAPRGSARRMPYFSRNCAISCAIRLP